MNIQRIVTPDELNQFINLLRNMYVNKNGLYFYRGLRNSDYELLPGAFRPGDIRNKEILFGGDKARRLAYTSKASDIVVMSCNGNLQAAKQYMASREYERVIDIIVFITRHNFAVSSFIDENKAVYDQKSVEALLHRPVECWLTEEIFYRGLRDYLRGLEVQVSTDRKQIYKEPYIFNHITPYDESLAQHYCGYPTTMLDWTYNPYIALYFALPKNPKTADYLYFSVCVCEKPTQDDGTIFFTELYLDPTCPEFNENNLRIQRQEGLFSRMQLPVSVYYQKGFWPSIEKMIESYPSMCGNIRITRYNISIQFTEYIRSLLNDIGFNEDYLLPKIEVYASIS
jgi:hypothetical protein